MKKGFSLKIEFFINENNDKKVDFDSFIDNLNRMQDEEIQKIEFSQEILKETSSLCQNFINKYKNEL